MNQNTFRRLISGRSSGFGAAALRLLLAVAAQMYKIIIAIRNQLYDKNILKSYRVNAAVLSVGNITAGGTGKTPLVIWLCNTITENLKPCPERSRRIKAKNYGCAILTRGYKTNRKIRNTQYAIRNTIDEPAVLAENCPQAKVIINPNRVEAANLTIKNFGANVLIMDDGFQHRRLKRDLDIVTIDATCPFGFGKIIPAGLLRESLDGLKRADAAVITRCDQIGEGKLAELKEQLKSLNPNMLIATSTHKPICVRSKDEEIKLEQLKGKKIFAFCGIGNPEAFFNTIEKLGVNLIGTKIFSDHYQYKDEDINEIHQLAEQKKADLILTTQKDFSKLKTCPERLVVSGVEPSQRGGVEGTKFAYLAIELEFVENEDKIIKLLENTLAGKIGAK